MEDTVLQNEGMDPVIKVIRNTMEECLDAGKDRFVIFPYGDVGIKVKTFLNEAYGIKEEFIVDNHFCKYNPIIKSGDYFKEVDCSDLTVILATMNDSIYTTLRSFLPGYFSEGQIAELAFGNKQGPVDEPTDVENRIGVGGRYSYGPILDNYWAESIGNFCSFAGGTDIVMNHATDYISTHPIIYHGFEANPILPNGYEDRGQGSGMVYGRYNS